MRKLFDYQTSGKSLKKIVFDDCYYYDDDAEMKDAIGHLDQLLQIIVPLSPKQIELKNRLTKELTQEIQSKLRPQEIDELRSKIINQVDEKYNPKFDENEIHHGKKYEWHSPVEMIEMITSHGNVEHAQVVSHLSSQLSSQRIQGSLTNLKSVALGRLGSRNPESQLEAFECIGVSLLNNVCNQLESLHIDDTMEGINGWKFVQNEYPYTKQSKNKWWHPANIKQLCLYSRAMPQDANSEHLWHKINGGEMFSKLKHLKIQNTLDICNQQFLTNSSNASINGRLSHLSSLELRFTRLQLKDIYDHHADLICENKYENRDSCLIDELLLTIQNMIVASSRNSKIENENESKKKDFVLKIALEFDVSSNDNIENTVKEKELQQQSKKLDKIGASLSMLYLSLLNYFGNIMVCFKLIFTKHGKNRNVVNMIGTQIGKFVARNKMIFSSSDSQAVDIRWDNSSQKVLFAVVFKNVNTGTGNVSCSRSHMEPTFEYSCSNCKPTPWLEC